MAVLASEGAPQEGHRHMAAGVWEQGRAATRPPSPPPLPPAANRRRRRRAVPLVPRATRPAHDAAGTAEWHRWILAQVWPSWQAKGAPQEGHRHRAAGVWEQGRAATRPSPPPTVAAAGPCHKCHAQHGLRTMRMEPLNGTGGPGASMAVLASEGAPQEGHRHMAAGVWGAGPCCHSTTVASRQPSPPPPGSATSATRNTACARCSWDR